MRSFVVLLSLALTCCTMGWIRPNVARTAPPVRSSVDGRPFEVSRIDLAASNVEIDNFSRSIRVLIKNRNFAGLDEMAARFSSTKERFIGGGWKIYSFQSTLSEPADDQTSDESWIAQIAFLKSWKAANPASVAARCSLVSAYMGFAWVARGNGFANEVPESAWPAINERLDSAASELKDISDPAQYGYGYYWESLEVARALGLDRKTFDQIFADALKFDPTYQYFYTSKASYLLPRWNGAPGEWQAFTEETKKKIGGDEGLEMYYLIVAEINGYQGYHGREMYDQDHISWADTRAGFQLYEKQYGMTRSKLNQFANMAFRAADADVACKTFGQITSDDFDPGTWKDKETFEKYRQMATVMCKMPKANNQAQ